MSLPYDKDNDRLRGYGFVDFADKGEYKAILRMKLVFEGSNLYLREAQQGEEQASWGQHLRGVGQGMVASGTETMASEEKAMETTSGGGTDHHPPPLPDEVNLPIEHHQVLWIHPIFFAVSLMVISTFMDMLVVSISPSNAGSSIRITRSPPVRMSNTSCVVSSE